MGFFAGLVTVDDDDGDDDMLLGPSESECAAL
jgi:hypothetical protein